MTTDILIERAKERLNRTGNPPFPPEATLSAIIQLGKERDEAKARAESLAEKVSELAAKENYAEVQKEEMELERKRATDFAKEQEWLAHELGKFVRDVSNGMYAGREIAAAKRVYDLNSGSIKKKRLNAYNFESLDEAKAAYREHCQESGLEFNEIIDEANFLSWLFEYAKSF